MDNAVSCLSKHIVVELILCGTLFCLFQPRVLATQSVVLSWTPSISSNAVGYRIYSGLASHNYSSFVTIGKTNTTTISGLADGAVYYFAAVSCDGLGDDSPFSNEVVYSVPSAAAKLATLPESASRFSFSVSGVSGYQYVVQSSTNLVNWVSVQTNTSPFIFTNTSTAGSSESFYRTFYLPH
jgi:hypothetical protein